MILLERLLANLQVGVEPFAICEVRGGAALAFAPVADATVHYTLAGEGAIRLGGGVEIAVVPHSFVVVPPRMRQRITHRPARIGDNRLPLRACASVVDGMRRLRAGEGADGVIMACGAIRATYRRMAGLFDYLPEPIVESFSGDDPIRRAFEQLLAELAEPQPGSAAMTEALMKECLVLLLRRHCAGGECRVPWLTALEDERLGAALAAMLDAPEKPHTVERLAERASMSRSSFAQRFAAAFGRPPMDFLKEVRLRRAAALLRTTDLPVKVVAARVGYGSRSYFSRAFKAFYGIDPARFRRAPAAEAPVCAPVDPPPPSANRPTQPRSVVGGNQR